MSALSQQFLKTAISSFEHNDLKASTTDEMRALITVKTHEMLTVLFNCNGQNRIWLGSFKYPKMVSLRRYGNI